MHVEQAELELSSEAVASIIGSVVPGLPESPESELWLELEFLPTAAELNQGC